MPLASPDTCPSAPPRLPQVSAEALGRQHEGDAVTEDGLLVAEHVPESSVRREWAEGGGEPSQSLWNCHRRTRLTPGAITKARDGLHSDAWCSPPVNREAIKLNYET